MSELQSGVPFAVMLAECALPTNESDWRFRVHASGRVAATADVAVLVHGHVGQTGAMPLVRLHSCCLTGDVFGSLRCDCGPQLLESKRRIAAEPSGALLYFLHHEGRGIGLANKVRAYTLQQHGCDTVSANVHLGLPVDARDFSLAAPILKSLGVRRVRLLTNNPLKVEALAKGGITVVERVPLVGFTNRHNAAYLEAKASLLGHIYQLMPPANRPPM